MMRGVAVAALLGAAGVGAAPYNPTSLFFLPPSQFAPACRTLFTALDGECGDLGDYWSPEVNVHPNGPIFSALETSEQETCPSACSDVTGGCKTGSVVCDQCNKVTFSGRHEDHRENKSFVGSTLGLSFYLSLSEAASVSEAENLAFAVVLDACDGYSCTPYVNGQSSKLYDVRISPVVEVGGKYFEFKPKNVIREQLVTLTFPIKESRWRPYHPRCVHEEESGYVAPPSSYSWYDNYAEKEEGFCVVDAAACNTTFTGVVFNSSQATGCEGTATPVCCGRTEGLPFTSATPFSSSNNIGTDMYFNIDTHNRYGQTQVLHLAYLGACGKTPCRVANGKECDATNEGLQICRSGLSTYCECANSLPFTFDGEYNECKDMRLQADYNALTCRDCPAYYQAIKFGGFPHDETSNYAECTYIYNYGNNESTVGCSCAHVESGVFGGSQRTCLEGACTGHTCANGSHTTAVPGQPEWSCVCECDEEGLVPTNFTTGAGCAAPSTLPPGKECTICDTTHGATCSFDGSGKETCSCANLPGTSLVEIASKFECRVRCDAQCDGAEGAECKNEWETVSGKLVPKLTPSCGCISAADTVATMQQVPSNYNNVACLKCSAGDCNADSYCFLNVGNVTNSVAAAAGTVNAVCACKYGAKVSGVCPGAPTTAATAPTESRATTTTKPCSPACSTRHICQAGTCVCKQIFDTAPDGSCVDKTSATKPPVGTGKPSGAPSAPSTPSAPSAKPAAPGAPTAAPTASGVRTISAFGLVVIAVLATLLM